MNESTMESLKHRPSLRDVRDAESPPCPLPAWWPEALFPDVVYAALFLHHLDREMWDHIVRRWAVGQDLPWHSRCDLHRVLRVRARNRSCVPLSIAGALGWQTRHLREEARLSRSAFSTIVLGRAQPDARLVRGMELGYALRYEHLQMIADYLDLPLRVAFPDAFAGWSEDDVEIVEYTTCCIDEQVTERLLTEEVHAMLDRLPGREREVIVVRFGLAGGDEMTLEEVGERLGMTRERVRRIQAQAMMKLRSSAYAIEMRGL
jgi:RNA polymerase sigma factor (sigma-70 family)